jgi:lipid-A-disaccharide synthase
MGASELLIVAGEASGDLKAARLLGALRSRRPDLRAFGLGGHELQTAGLEALAHSSEISVIGITEVVKILGRARQIFAELLKAAEERRPAAAILVDFPDFNLRLAKKLHEKGIPVLYYVSPQVWAWRKRRVRHIDRYVDRMMVVFPFEEEFYRSHGVDVVYVGHPLMDEVAARHHAWDDDPEGTDGYRVALLPGSRRSELEVLLPIVLESARLLSRSANVRFQLMRAGTITPGELAPYLDASGLEIEVVSERRFQAIADSHLAICAVGTANLEVGLVGTPMVTLHRVGALSYLAGRMLVDLPYASIVNLLLDKPSVPEFLQWRAKPESIAAKSAELLRGRGQIADMRADLMALRERIGPGGASERAADEVLGFLSPDS